MLQAVTPTNRPSAAKVDKASSVRRLGMLDMAAPLETVPGVPVSARAAITVGENPDHLAAVSAWPGVWLSHSGTACKVPYFLG